MLDVPRHQLVVPYPFKYLGLLGLTDKDWDLLQDRGLEILDLSPEELANAHRFKIGYPKLSANDCFSVAAAKARDNSLVISENPQLRLAAGQTGLCACGLLWVIDELQAAKACSIQRLIAALRGWRNDGKMPHSDRSLKHRVRRLRRFTQAPSGKRTEVTHAWRQ